MIDSAIGRRDIPSGTVTFLFSDIEGSTQRWEAHRDAMEDAVRRHDAIMRSAIEVHDGYVFKTIGDAFCAAFSNAHGCLAAAYDAQRAISADEWLSVDGLRVRMAIHTGSTDERDGDYFGPAVNRVARLLAVAHGAQVITSGVTADLLQGRMPAQTSLRDLGAHRLKDLTHPEQVYQLVSPELRSDFPPLRSLDAYPNNLPRAVTSFVGRDDDLREIKALVQKSDLVTLVGTGGVGKTRIALQVAADLLDNAADGAWLVELAPVADGALVASTILAALEAGQSSDRSALDQLLRYLKDRQLLIVLDNCEHVVTDAGETVAAIVRKCRGVKIIATSREGLNVPGERVYRMPSLSVPLQGARVTAAQAGTYGAVALFVERAQAADDRFVLTDENAVAVADICRRLDGIALAIELAAPRVKVLSVQHLAQRLDERFRILTGGSKTAFRVSRRCVH